MGILVLAMFVGVSMAMRNGDENGNGDCDRLRDGSCDVCGDCDRNGDGWCDLCGYDLVEDVPGDGIPNGDNEGDGNQKAEEGPNGPKGDGDQDGEPDRDQNGRD